RAVYNWLQMSLKQNLNLANGRIKRANLQLSYAFSRYVATAQDTDFINFAEDNNHATQFIGPNGLDRKHQISFGGTVELPYSLRLSVISHFYSPLPLNLRLPTSGLAGGIFITDVTGDGTGDGAAGSDGGYSGLGPGSKLWDLGRSV